MPRAMGDGLSGGAAACGGRLAVPYRRRLHDLSDHRRHDLASADLHNRARVIERVTTGLRVALIRTTPVDCGRPSTTDASALSTLVDVVFLVVCSNACPVEAFDEAWFACVRLT
jgi:hypothetical protein